MHRVVQQIDPVDHNCRCSHALYTKQHNPIPSVLLAQVQGFGDSHIKVEPECPNVEEK